MAGTYWELEQEEGVEGAAEWKEPVSARGRRGPRRWVGGQRVPMKTSGLTVPARAAVCVHVYARVLLLVRAPRPHMSAVGCREPEGPAP